MCTRTTTQSTAIKDDVQGQLGGAAEKRSGLVVVCLFLLLCASLWQICAIVGGVFTVAGILDSVIYTGQRKLAKKLELGKDF